MGNVEVQKNKEGYELNLNALIYSELLMSNVRFLVTNQICRDEETTREILTKEEINLVMETPITRKYMGLVRDLYLFCCFTGLAFIDLYNLKEENIKTFFDDGEWIVIHRQKTGTEADIKLLDYPKQIMEKYRGLCKDGRVFPVPPYRNCLRSLKRLGKKCGITKPLSWHVARHLFATSVCLSNGVPIETVSSMLGHKDHGD